MRFVLICASVLATTASASAQFGNLTYNFFGTAGTQTISSVGALAGAPNAPTQVSFAGVSVEPLVNMINSKQWTNQGAPDEGKYYSFSFTTAQAISIANISVNALSTVDGPATLDIRSSITGFTTTIASQTITPGTTSPVTFALPSASYGNIADATNVEFRIYGYNAGNNGANSQLGFLSTSAADHGITIPIAAPVPEPVSVMAASVLGLGAFGFARRRMFGTK